MDCSATSSFRILYPIAAETSGRKKPSKRNRKHGKRNNKRRSQKERHLIHPHVRKAHQNLEPHRVNGERISRKGNLLEKRRKIDAENVRGGQDGNLSGHTSFSSISPGKNMGGGKIRGTLGRRMERKKKNFQV